MAFKENVYRMSVSELTNMYTFPYSRVFQPIWSMDYKTSEEFKELYEDLMTLITKFKKGLSSSEETIQNIWNLRKVYQERYPETFPPIGWYDKKVSKSGISGEEYKEKENKDYEKRQKKRVLKAIRREKEILENDLKNINRIICILSFITPELTGKEILWSKVKDKIGLQVNSKELLECGFIERIRKNGDNRIWIFIDEEGYEKAKKKMQGLKEEVLHRQEYLERIRYE